MRVYRVRFAQNGSVRSWVVKRLEPGLGKRNELVATRWLPAVGLGDCDAKLAGVAGAPSAIACGTCMKTSATARWTRRKPTASA